MACDAGLIGRNGSGHLLSFTLQLSTLVKGGTAYNLPGARQLCILSDIRTRYTSRVRGFSFCKTSKNVRFLTESPSSPAIPAEVASDAPLSGVRVVRSCPVCGGHEAEPLKLYSISGWPLVTCTGCGFVFLREVPGEAALASELAWEKTSAAERQRRERRPFSSFDRLTRWRLRPGKWQDRLYQRLAIGNGGNVLDIGCGGHCRLPPGVTPFGIEVSKALAAKSDPKFRARGGHVVCAPARVAMADFDDGFFSAMVMRSYLEHEENPDQVLRLAFAKLKPGGSIYLRVPNYGSLNRRIMGAEWCGFRFPDHVNYFTGRSLKRLATQCGFSYLRRNRASILDDNLLVVLSRPT